MWLGMNHVIRANHMISLITVQQRTPGSRCIILLLLLLLLLCIWACVSDKLELEKQVCMDQYFLGTNFPSLKGPWNNIFMLK